MSVGYKANSTSGSHTMYYSIDSILWSSALSRRPHHPSVVKVKPPKECTQWSKPRQKSALWNGLSLTRNNLELCNTQCSQPVELLHRRNVQLYQRGPFTTRGVTWGTLLSLHSRTEWNFPTCISALNGQLGGPLHEKPFFSVSLCTCPSFDLFLGLFDLTWIMYGVVFQLDDRWSSKCTYLAALSSCDEESYALRRGNCIARGKSRTWPGLDTQTMLSINSISSI